MSHLKTGKRELILKLSLFSHRFVLHGRGAIETTVHRILSDGINMITVFQTFAFLMFMLKISRVHGRLLVVTCSAQKHLITRSRYDENFKCHIHRLSGFYQLMSYSIRQMSAKMSAGQNKRIIFVYFAS